MRYFLFFIAVEAAFGQLPRVQNAKIQQRAAGALEPTFQALTADSDSPAWIAYTVPSANTSNNSCCWADSYRGCALEGQNRSQNPPVATGPVMLEGSSSLVVLYRVVNRTVDKIRTVSGDCELDAGGLPFTVLTGVRPAESVAMLEKMVGEKNDHPISAIAMHGDPSADAALERLASPPQPERVREKTLFWLGSLQRKSGYQTLKRIALQDPNERIREKAMFPLSLSKDPDAVSTMIEAAKNDSSTRVRGQALFWLGHKAGQKETAAIAGAIDNDPDVGVKKKALFALTQMPKDEGVPKLIEIARTHKTPEIRKQAMFWLGQSHDPRALAFFQEVLK